MTPKSLNSMIICHRNSKITLIGKDLVRFQSERIDLRVSDQNIRQRQIV